MVNRCGRGQQVRRNVESGGKLRRGQQVRTWSTGCGETWSQAGRLRRGQQVRRNVVSRCDETWGQQVRRDVVNRCGRGQVRRNVESGGQLRRGQQVRRDVVNRCRNAVSRCGKRGQPVRKTRSAGAGNAVNRCVERGQQVRRNTVFANVLKVLRTLPDLPDLPDLSRKGEREESRWRRALPLTRHAATGFSSTPDFSSLNLSPASTIGGGGGLCPRSRHSPSARRPARSASGSTSFDGTAATGGRGVPHRSRRRRYVDTRAGAVRLPDAGGARFAVSVSSATSAIEESRS